MFNYWDITDVRIREWAFSVTYERKNIIVGNLSNDKNGINIFKINFSFIVLEWTYLDKHGFSLYLIMSAFGYVSFFMSRGDSLTIKILSCYLRDPSRKVNKNLTGSCNCIHFSLKQRNTISKSLENYSFFIFQCELTSFLFSFNHFWVKCASFLFCSFKCI